MRISVVAVLAAVLSLLSTGAPAQLSFPEPQAAQPQPAQGRSAEPDVIELTPPPLPDVEAGEAAPAPATPVSGDVSADIEDVDGIVENELCHAQFFENGSPAKAIFHCTRALESGDLSEGDVVTALVNRGVAYKLNGQLELAVDDYTKALEISPESGDIYTTRANAYLEMSQLDAAINDANKAIAFSPDYAAAYYVRGRIFEALGQSSFARDDFLRAYELAPDNKDIEEKAWSYGANQN